MPFTHTTLLDLLLAAALLSMTVGAFMAMRAARELHLLDEGEEIHSEIEFSELLARRLFGWILVVFGIGVVIWWRIIS